MNFVWKPFSESLGESVEIFSSAMRDHYCWPPGFNWDEYGYYLENVVTDETLTSFNADAKTEQMMEYV